MVSKVNQSESTSKNVSVLHVDGGTRALKRKRHLRWLAESIDDRDVCRILSNARCLSEGIDVPALDCVVFMEPRRSVVDVVQAVGRIMRKSRGKKYGYVILPVAVPAGVDINDTLDDNRTWGTVWEVLNALRSHDPDLNLDINKLVLDKKISNGRVGEKIRLMSVTDSGQAPDKKYLDKFYAKLASKLVEKVGDANYYDKYGEKLGRASRAIEERITAKIRSSDAVLDEVRNLHASLKTVINDAVTQDDAVRVMAQHLVLSRVFDAMFQGEFQSHNPISVALDGVAKKVGLDEELEGLEDFYNEAQSELREVTTREARQNFIKKIYENFFKSVSKNETKQHGVVYTPVEIVDFHKKHRTCPA